MNTQSAQSDYATPVAAQSKVLERLGRACSAQDRVLALLDALESRLAPVLKAQPESKDKGAPGGSAEPGSPLAESIDSHADQIYGGLHRLNSIIERLEI